MNYDIIDTILSICQSKIRDLSDSEKVEVLKTLRCKLRDKIDYIESQMPSDDEPTIVVRTTNLQNHSCVQRVTELKYNQLKAMNCFKSVEVLEPLNINTRK